MGVPTCGTDREYLYLAAEGCKYHPDLVILCAFYNDFRFLDTIGSGSTS